MSKECDLVEYVLKQLVDDPEHLRVHEIEGSRSLILEVSASTEDLGKVIGKKGRIIRAVRTVLSAASLSLSKHRRVVLEVIDDRGERMTEDVSELDEHVENS